MKITAQVVLINQEGLVLGVSRKTDHNDMGLIGGKKEDIDLTPEDTAIREAKEETGLDISNLRLVFAIHKDGFMSYTYLADYSGEINHNEPHVVKWVPFIELFKGSFGEYNKMVYESLDDLICSLKGLVDDENSETLNSIPYIAFFDEKSFYDDDDDDDDDLFPVLFNGKEYFEENCDSVFLSFYSCREGLNYSGGVYMSEGFWVYPDGSMDEY